MESRESISSTVKGAQDLQEGKVAKYSRGRNRKNRTWKKNVGDPNGKMSQGKRK